MKHRHLLILALVVFGLAIPQTARSQDKADKVRLYVEGAYCAGCASVLTEALAEGGVKSTSKLPSNFGRGHVIVMGQYAHDADLSKIAKVINAAATPHRNQVQPGVSLEIFAPLNEDSGQTALKTLAKSQGVNAEGSSIDLVRGAISVRLTGEGKVSVNDLLASLKQAGIDGQIRTEGAEAPAADSKEAK